MRPDSRSHNVSNGDDDDYEEIDVIVEEDDADDDDHIQTRHSDDDATLDDASINKQLRDEAQGEDDAVLFSLAEQRRRAKQLEKDYLGAQVRAFQNDYDAKKKELEYYENELITAVDCADGVSATAVIRLRDEVQNQLRLMEAQWQQADANYTEHLKQEPVRVKKLAGEFLKKYGWENMSEAMRKKWLKVDDKIVKAGYDPAEPEYYKKLENTLKGMGLLNTKQRTQASNRSSNQSSVGAPRKVAQHNGAETIKLSRQRSEAIEMMGYEKGSPQYIRMAKAYQKYDQEGGAEGSSARLWNVGSAN